MSCASCARAEPLTSALTSGPARAGPIERTLMTRLFHAVTLGVGLPAGATTAHAAGRDYPLTPTAAPITIDGRLDEPAWERATPIPLGYEYFPGDNTAAQVETV